MGFRLLWGVGVLGVVLASGALAQRPPQSFETQWKPSAPAVTLHQLIADGYEIKTSHPTAFAGGRAWWVYLQKGNAVYRCQDELEQAGDKGIPNCSELVAPFRRAIK